MSKLLQPPRGPRGHREGPPPAPPMSVHHRREPVAPPRRPAPPPGSLTWAQVRDRIGLEPRHIELLVECRHWEDVGDDLVLEADVERFEANARESRLRLDRERAAAQEGRS